MKASKVSIDDKRTGLAARFAKKNDVPDIDGCNFFTGEYASGSGLIGYNSADPDLWNSFWRDTVKQKAPGPLPKGAMAVMIAQHSPKDPVEFVPETLTRDNKGMTVHWKRLHTAEKGDSPNLPSHFAVLILPMKGGNTQFFRDVFVADEKQAAAERLADAVKVLTTGSKDRITLMPVTKLKKKM